MEKTEQQLQMEKNNTIAHRLAIVFCSVLDRTEKPIPAWAAEWWKQTSRWMKDREKLVADIGDKEDIAAEISRRRIAALGKLDDADRLVLGLPQQEEANEG